MGISDRLICLLRNLYVGQEATGRTGHRTMDWFRIGKGIHQDCILSPCLFNLYSEWSEVKWKSLSHVQLFAVPWTIESMEFSRPEYWSRWSFPSSEDLPYPGIKPGSPALQVDFLATELWRKPSRCGGGDQKQTRVCERHGKQFLGGWQSGRKRSGAHEFCLLVLERPTRTFVTRAFQVRHQEGT